MKIICYGDSNTYGYDAADLFGSRLPPDQRWTDLLAEMLHCDVVNCGMNGRTVPRYPRSMENDFRLIRRAMPFDLLIVMLGTNDLLNDYDPEDTAEALAAFLDQFEPLFPTTQILLTAPAQIVGLGGGYADLTAEYAARCKVLAEQRGWRFADASQWQIAMACDGVHFSPEGHQLFARRMFAVIAE